MNEMMVMDDVTAYRGIRYRVSRRLYLWACQIFDDYHEFELTGPAGDIVRFFAYGDVSGRWPSDWEFRCSCGGVGGES